MVPYWHNRGRGLKHPKEAPKPWPFHAQGRKWPGFGPFPELLHTQCRGRPPDRFSPRAKNGQGEGPSRVCFFPPAAAGGGCSRGLFCILALLLNRSLFLGVASAGRPPEVLFLLAGSNVRGVHGRRSWAIWMRSTGSRCAVEFSCSWFSRAAALFQMPPRAPD